MNTYNNDVNGMVQVINQDELTANGLDHVGFGHIQVICKVCGHKFGIRLNEDGTINKLRLRCRECDSNKYHELMLEIEIEEE